MTFRCGKVVFAAAAEFKPNHQLLQSLTLEGALEHLLRLQCNDHQTEKATFRNKSLPGIYRKKRNAHELIFFYKSLNFPIINTNIMYGLRYNS